MDLFAILVFVGAISIAGMAVGAYSIKRDFRLKEKRVELEKEKVKLEQMKVQLALKKDQHQEKA
ncbi:hypothetical protein [Alteribacter keqinensis]|uniref:Uncharacterized protein n=1 Tax=Alteribacter keqinensis TaxID=2483800 RepID=A0A3M7TXH3_9BACI|nr:hypothetical protein [Alteribacter keqinensis]RNA70193.1 hypothetical protein EBO34_09780 [Alteribacter keqinensis]